MKKAYKPIYLKARRDRHTLHKIIIALLVTTVALGGYAYHLKALADLRLKAIENNIEWMTDLMEYNYSLNREIDLIPEDTFFPSDNTVKIMNGNVGVTAKIHAKFGDNWMKWAQLIADESSFDKFAINPTSGACGLAQALPCSKMKCNLNDVGCQLNWIEEYVNDRYGSIERALYHWQIKGWY
jgi:hypothetical protein